MTSNNFSYNPLKNNLYQYEIKPSYDIRSCKCSQRYKQKCQCFKINTYSNGNSNPWNSFTPNPSVENITQKLKSFDLKSDSTIHKQLDSTIRFRNEPFENNIPWNPYGVDRNGGFDTFESYPISPIYYSLWDKNEKYKTPSNCDVWDAPWNNNFDTEAHGALRLCEKLNLETTEINYLDWHNKDDSECKLTSYNAEEKNFQDSNNTNYLNETIQDYQSLSKSLTKNEKNMENCLCNGNDISSPLEISRPCNSPEFSNQEGDNCDQNEKSYRCCIAPLRRYNNGKVGYRLSQNYVPNKSNNQQFTFPKIDSLLDYPIFASRVNCDVGTTERHGGLTWNRHSNNVLLPYIENTWLKHMIDSLKDKPEWYERFFNNLEKCLKDAVTFLYRQGIKPYLGDVANQMKRSVADNFWSAAEVAYVSINCKDIVKLKIELRVKGEMGWVVYLAQEPPWFKGFVNTHSTIDNYSPYYWRALNKFSVDMVSYNNAKNGDISTVFSGGRYAFAERLKEQVDAFKDMRLGQVVHLVQLAIYSGIFVYAQRILLPVTACEKTAEELFPRQKKVRYPVCMSIREVAHIISLLVDHRRNGMVLAQLKQQFMLQFNRELNPMYFGYRKLQNLLLSETFSENYNLFVPIDSPHRTHLQNKKYPIPNGCRIFQQSKLAYDPKRFWTPMDDWYDQLHVLKGDNIIENMPIVVENVMNSLNLELNLDKE
ncbi:Protein PFF0380w [Babesia microti strain RI]|uniref:Protein PFF0380w n=1 Tax=Babesia microti (strain RI) TaxID=1133968 RepID=I7IA38_BABMR|nr:Protein PFF0380w [Babesia microti strain RI]CCF76089.1 Protein PFF0380w [Babesia microti strain RI]|eukprot:XP_012650497.1 Protein PFF0380w [Babesia microti strain RI]